MVLKIKKHDPLLSIHSYYFVHLADPERDYGNRLGMCIANDYYQVASELPKNIWL